MKIGLNTPKQLQIDKDNLARWVRNMERNNTDFDERLIWQEKDEFDLSMFVWLLAAVGASLLVVAGFILLILL